MSLLFGLELLINLISKPVIKTKNLTIKKPEINLESLTKKMVRLVGGAVKIYECNNHIYAFEVQFNESIKQVMDLSFNYAFNNEEEINTLCGKPLGYSCIIFHNDNELINLLSEEIIKFSQYPIYIQELDELMNPIPESNYLLN